MRGNPLAHGLIAPGSLPDVLQLLSTEPGKWTPIAGGTELMVAHAAGRLEAAHLVSLWGIPELRSPLEPEALFAICALMQESPSNCRCWPKLPVGSAQSPIKAAPRSVEI
jgi:hypothetical protein